MKFMTILFLMFVTLIVCEAQLDPDKQDEHNKLADSLIGNELDSIKKGKELLLDYIYNAISNILSIPLVTESMEHEELLLGQHLQQSNTKNQ